MTLPKRVCYNWNDRTKRSGKSSSSTPSFLYIAIQQKRRIKAHDKTLYHYPDISITVEKGHGNVLHTCLASIKNTRKSHE